MLELLLVMVAVGSPIFIVVFIIQYFKYRTEIRSQLSELKQELDVRSSEELHADISDLKERVQSLEKIVTNGKYELLRDIERLEK